MNNSTFALTAIKAPAGGWSPAAEGQGTFPLGWEIFVLWLPQKKKEQKPKLSLNSLPR